MIYLATPYSHDREAGYRYAQEAAVALLIRNLPVFSPILHWHETAIKFGLPTDAEFWWLYNRSMLRTSSQLIIYKVGEWRKSSGIALEIKYARENAIDIEYMEPLTHG